MKVVVRLTKSFKLVGLIDLTQKEITVSLITIYDKDEVSSITGEEIKTLIASRYLD